MRAGIVLISIIGIGGCATGPDYERPPLPVPATLGDAAAANDIRLPDWSSYFADSTLIDLVNHALEHNRDLRVATARIDEARAQYGIQRADQVPSFSVNADATLARTPAPLSVTGQSTVTRRYDVNLGLLAYELDFWGRVRRLSEAARANYLASEEAQRAFRLSLIGDVANAYYNVRALEQRVEFARKTAQTREEGMRVIDRRFEAGVASRLEKLQAESALESARADAALLARQAANARTALAVLVGQPLSISAPTLSVLDDLPLPAPLPAGLSSNALLRRPDVLRAELNLVAANADIGAARAAFLPSITLIGSAGVASNQLDDLFQGNRRAWSFLPSISLPLFHGGRNQATLDVAEARNVIAVAQYEKAIQVAFQEVADVLSDQAWLAEQYAAQQRLAQQQAERLRLAEARYNAGLIAFLEVLDAQRENYAAQQALIDAKRLRLAAAAQAYKALGGL
jgi:outer membrane protein, multidrug efflux system